ILNSSFLRHSSLDILLLSERLGRAGKPILRGVCRFLGQNPVSTPIFCQDRRARPEERGVGKGVWTRRERILSCWSGVNSKSGTLWGRLCAELTTAMMFFRKSL